MLTPVTSTRWAILMAALLAVVSMPASSEELEFDLSGTALSADGQSSVGPWNTMFMLDTRSGAQQLSFSPSGCMTGLNVGGASFSNLNMTLNGNSVMSATSLLGNYSGGDIVDAAMQFTNNGSTFTWEFGGSLGAGCFNGDDPLAAMFLSLHGSGPAALETASGNMPLDITHVSVHVVSVPEPETFGLLTLGLLGVLLSSAGASKAGAKIAVRPESRLA